MYKTAIYTLVNDIITHQKQQIKNNVILLSLTGREAVITLLCKM